MPALLRSCTPLEQTTAVNKCCLYLQVLSLSDITNGNGTRLTDTALHSNRDNEQHHYYEWPNQPRPPEWAWTIWNDWLSQVFTPMNKELAHPLGNWTISPSTWQWFHAPEEDSLYYYRKLCGKSGFLFESSVPYIVSSMQAMSWNRGCTPLGNGQWCNL